MSMFMFMFSVFRIFHSRLRAALPAGQNTRMAQSWPGRWGEALAATRISGSALETEDVGMAIWPVGHVHNTHLVTKIVANWRSRTNVPNGMQDLGSVPG